MGNKPRWCPVTGNYIYEDPEKGKLTVDHDSGRVIKVVKDGTEFICSHGVNDPVEKLTGQKFPPR